MGVVLGVAEERVAGNEALFREVNERMAETAERFAATEDDATPLGFVCECGRAGCAEKMSMTLAEYERVRSVPTHFAVVPGHELPGVERVVERHGTHLVVEKRDGDADRVARETDPRS
jgi:hypothetical protein